VIERDRQLALEAQQGNMQAFASLVDLHQGRVYRTLYQVVGDERDAQDLSQEVFLKVYRSLVGYRGDAAFSTWLHRLTLNLAFDWLRARRRRPLQVPLEPPADHDDRPALTLVSADDGPEEETLRTERHREIQQAIRNLPPDYREVVMLHHFRHMSYQQIAERIDAPVRTVETRLYRARHLLKKLLTAGEGGASDELQRSSATPARVLGSGAHA
jgi:RNA polymerase sigma-70 factor (ECF subfamily)